MNKNMIFVLTGGFLVAVLVSVLMVSFLKPATKAVPQTQKIASKAVLTTTQSLKTGDRLTSANTAWKDWPEDAVFPGLIIRTKANENGLDQRVSRPLTAGEPVIKSALMKDSPNLLAAALEKGMRAVALNVNAASTAGGFITPGDMVDVIVTFAIRTDKDSEKVTDEVLKRYVSETILENVKVLAIDQKADKPKDGSRVGRTVTLAVKNKGARELMLAAQMGELSLALRGVGDESVQGRSEDIVTDVTTAKIYGEIARLQEKSPVSSSRSVRVLSNTGVQFIQATAPVYQRVPSQPASDANSGKVAQSHD